MGQDLTTPLAPLPFREAEAKIEALHGRLEPVDGHPTRFCVRADRAVTTTERQQLSAVRDRLERELEPCAEPDHVRVVVSKLLLGFEQGRGGSALNTAALNEEYREALADLPLAAIHRAAERFRTGRTLTTWKPGFRPTPPEFANEARAGMVTVRTSLVRVRQILAAEVYQPPTAEQLAEVEKARKAATAYLTARMPQADTHPVLTGPDEGPRTDAEIVAPLLKLDCSHLMANLDRRKVQA
jgi:hypothetical protein